MLYKRNILRRRNTFRQDIFHFIAILLKKKIIPCIDMYKEVSLSFTLFPSQQGRRARKFLSPVSTASGTDFFRTTLNLQK